MMRSLRPTRRMASSSMKSRGARKHAPSARAARAARESGSTRSTSPATAAARASSGVAKTSAVISRALAAPMPVAGSASAKGMPKARLGVTPRRSARGAGRVVVVGGSGAGRVVVVVEVEVVGLTVVEAGAALAPTGGGEQGGGQDDGGETAAGPAEWSHGRSG